MIEYEPGRLGIGFIFSCKGSVFPKAICWAGPATAAAIFLHSVVEHNPNMNISQVWVAYNFILGFLIVFRTQQAYSRFWEGATILQQVRGEWFNAISSCFAFCTAEPKRFHDVAKFQHLLVRLASLLYCTALQEVAVLKDEAFEILDLDGVSEDSLQYLCDAPDKCLVLLQWIQRLIVINHNERVIDVPPPVLSRVFQELSRGIVSIVDAQKITDIIFPFPYAQMVTTMLITTTVIAPYITAVLMRDAIWCGTLTFLSVFAYWSINYIAAEIEMPFGDDKNDLPIPHLQEGFIVSLRMLMDESSRNPPEYNFDHEKHAECPSVRCPFHLITDVQHKMWGSGHKKRMKAHLNAQVKDKARNSQDPSTMLEAPAAKIIHDLSHSHSAASKARPAKDTQAHATKMSPISSQSKEVAQNSTTIASSEKAISASLEEGSALVSNEIQEALISMQKSHLPDSNAVLADTIGVTLQEQKKADGPSQFSLHEHWFENKLSSVIARMRQHFLRISEDLTFISQLRFRHGAGSENHILPEAELSRFSASLEEHCCSISKGLGGLAVTLCRMQVDDIQMPSWVHDREGVREPRLSAPAELHLPL